MTTQIKDGAGNLVTRMTLDDLASTVGTPTAQALNTQLADGADATMGAKADAAYTDVTGAASGSFSSVLKGLFVALKSVLSVGGNVASGATDSGNPVKVGGRYNAAQPTLVDGQRGDMQLTNRGEALAMISARGTPAYTGIQGDNQQTFLEGLNTNSRTTWWNGVGWDRGKKPNLISRLVSSAATTNATSVKTSAGDVFLVKGVNKAASTRYLKLYNKASAPTVGTDTPFDVIELPATAAFSISYASPGLYFSTGIAYAITGGGADSDTTALSAGDITSLSIAYA